MVAILDASQLSYRHSADAPLLFENLSFALERGQTLAMLGRNGRGKTTLLKCLAGLLVPGTGTVTCGGTIGYVPQQFASPFAYTVFDVVLMGRARHIGLFSSPTAADRAHSAEALELVGLADFAERAIGTLSGGERQLVLIARALASEADILLLDEPTSALDYHNQAVVLAMLHRLSAERGMTVVMTTHDPSHALEIADRAILLHGHGKSEEGPIAEMCTEERLTALYAIPMKRLDYRIGDADASSIVARYDTRRGL